MTAPVCGRRRVAGDSCSGCGGVGAGPIPPHPPGPTSPSPSSSWWRGLERGHEVAPPLPNGVGVGGGIGLCGPVPSPGTLQFLVTGGVRRPDARLGPNLPLSALALLQRMVDRMAPPPPTGEEPGGEHSAGSRTAATACARPAPPASPPADTRTRTHRGHPGTGAQKCQVAAAIGDAVRFADVATGVRS